MTRKNFSREKGKALGFSSHVTLYSTFYGCDPAKLSDEEFLKISVLLAILNGGMKLLKLFFYKFEGGGEGITGIAIIGDSHIIVNTFPELGTMFIDIYTCSGDIMGAFYALLRRFNPRRYEVTIVPRVPALKNNPKIILREDEVKESDLLNWLRRRGLIPLLDIGEKFLSLVSLLGFMFGEGQMDKDLSSAHIYQRDLTVVEVLSKRLRDLKVKFRLELRERDGGIFELIINDKRLCRLLSILGAPTEEEKLKLPSWLVRENEIVKAVFLSSLLISKLPRSDIRSMEKGSLAISFSSENDGLEEFIKGLLEIAEGLHIKIKEVRRNRRDPKITRYTIKFDESEENIVRIQAITALSRLYPMGIFSLNLNMNLERGAYPNCSPYERILKFLMSNGSARLNEIARITRLSTRRTWEWLKRMEECGVVVNLSKHKEEKKETIWKLAVS